MQKFLLFVVFLALLLVQGAFAARAESSSLAKVDLKQKTAKGRSKADAKGKDKARANTFGAAKVKKNGRQGSARTWGSALGRD